MSTPTHSNLKPLAHSQEVRGGYLHVHFQCPLTQNEATSWARIGASHEEEDEGAGTLLGRARQALARLVGRTAGHRPEAPGADGAPTPQQLETAMVDAFLRVRSQFAWDKHGEQWVWAALKADVQGPLSRMLERVRFTEPADKRCLARMLAEVAMADGTVAPAEKQFFESFTGEQAGAIPQAMGSGELTEEDLTETTPFLREPMLALAWALAYTDQDLAAPEEARLERFAAGLHIGEARAEALRADACAYVLEEMLSDIYQNGEPEPAKRLEVARVASRLGASVEALDEVERRIRRLRGLSD
ncbi:MAG: TerB family tellurite resistance protein [Myxococcota bacterium]